MSRPANLWAWEEETEDRKDLQPLQEPADWEVAAHQLLFALSST